MSLESAALRDYMRRIDLTVAREEHRVTEVFRNIVREIFVDIVSHTPQFTGNLAQGWEIVFGPYGANGPQMYSNKERNELLHSAVKGDFDPFIRGEDPAVAIALDRELPKLKGLRWNSLVKIVNNIDYAEAVDAGDGPQGHDIRPENLYYGKVFMTSYASVKYGKLKNLVKIADA